MTIATTHSKIRNHWLGIFGLILFFAVLRWNSYDAPLIRDEGEYAYAAQLLVQGIAPYEHAFIQKPPMVIYSYALSNLLLPHIFWSPRLLAYLFVALATILLGYIARLEFGKGFAWPVMWLVTPMILLPEIDQFTANTEMFLLLPLLATVAVYVHSRHQGQKLKYWFAAGFLGATTLCYKYTALPVLAFVFIVWSVELWRDAKNTRQFGQCWLFAFCGALAALAVELGFFLVHDGGTHLWECTVQFNRYYASSSNFGLPALWAQLEIFWSAWWILFFLPLAAFLKPNPRRWFWIGIFICSLLATSASCNSQYYILMMPFWALLCVVGIRALAARISEWSSPASRWIACLITIVVMLLLIRSDVPWLKCSRERFVEVKMDRYPFRESQIVAARVAQLSSPDDFVFIAGSEPQILCYARRFSPTRFITAYSLMIPTPVALKYQQEAIQDLQKRSPSLIVFVISGSSWERHETTPMDFFVFLNNFLKQNYNVVGGYVVNGPERYWSEPLKNGEFANTSLVLYQRKGLPPEAKIGISR
jgi:Dolichyl-phosphate-mannose-protein mannosyltransferase